MSTRPATVGQSPFAQAVLDPNMAVPQGLIDPAGRPAGKRFDVYRNNVIVSLLDAMETAFPVIQKLIGAGNFRTLSGHYVRQHPPQTPVLMFYGVDFPEFLTGFEPLAHLPYLPDVARLELARRSSYHAADAFPVAGDALSQIDPARLMDTRFTLAPTMRIVPSPYPIVDIWDFNMIDGTPPPQAAAQTALITRPELDLEMQVILPEQADFLTAIAQGDPLGAAYDAATGINPNFDLSAAIVLMLQSGLITKIQP